APYHCRRRELLDAGRGFTEVVALPENTVGLPAGARYLFDAGGKPAGALGGPPAPAAMTDRLVPVVERPRPDLRDGLAFLPTPPRVRLMIVGGGHVGQAVARLAAEVDFDVWVVDDRAAYASRERFPSAERLIVGEIGPTLKDVAVTGIGPSTYCLIVTRGHNHDEEALYHLAAT